MAKKKTKQFKSFSDTAYTGYFGTEDEFECEVCLETLYYPQKKCPDCKTTYRYDLGVLKLIKPEVVKRVELPERPYRPEPIPEVLPVSFKQWLYSGLGWKESGGK